MANIIAKSGKAVELAGDIDTLLLDKTGTITIGNRKATQFVPLGGASGREVARVAGLSSMADQTPEGKSILELARQQSAVDGEAPRGAHVRRVHGPDPDERRQPSRRHPAPQRGSRHRREVREGSGRLDSRGLPGNGRLDRLRRHDTAGRGRRTIACWESSSSKTSSSRASGSGSRGCGRWACGS